MGIMDDILKFDSQFFCDPDVGFGETITYTPYLRGVAQATVTVNAVIDRQPPELMTEGPSRVQQIILRIPNLATVGLTTAPQRGDRLTAIWEPGEAASTMRVVDNLTRYDGGAPGMWTITAEKAIG